MEKKYYSTGEFAAKAHVTVRTIRFYDKKGLLSPAMKTGSGARKYTDEDFSKLEQILLLKYLGFSLEEIKELTIGSQDPDNLLNSLKIQRHLLEERIDEMKSVTAAIDKTVTALKKGNVDWNNMLGLIHLTSMEHSLKSQYQDASNISARIRLHRDFSTNKEGWFRWIYRMMGEAFDLSGGKIKILEIGCGDGTFWMENMDRLSANLDITLSDLSEGMVRDARRNIEKARLSRDNCPEFGYRMFDTAHIPFENESFDIVIANHVLFYLNDIGQAIREVKRVLKNGGIFISSTYSGRHMCEITRLVQKFNPDIVLAADELYKKFGLDNGMDILDPYFKNTSLLRYNDSIEINEAEPLVLYILSCHGNQNQMLLNRYKDFKEFVQKSVKKSFHITKDAGIFISRKDKN